MDYETLGGFDNIFCQILLEITHFVRFICCYVVIMSCVVMLSVVVPFFFSTR